MNKLEKIGQRIAEIRRSSGLSKIELAKKSGISKDYLGQVESGKRNITLEALQKICDGLGVSFEVKIGNERK